MTDGRMLLVGVLLIIGAGKAARFFIRTLRENALIRKHLGEGAYLQLTRDSN